MMLSTLSISKYINTTLLNIISISQFIKTGVRSIVFISKHAYVMLRCIVIISKHYKTTLRGIVSKQHRCFFLTKRHKVSQSHCIFSSIGIYFFSHG